jgi:hypothetical protein
MNKMDLGSPKETVKLIFLSLFNIDMLQVLCRSGKTGTI